MISHFWIWLILNLRKHFWFWEVQWEVIFMSTNQKIVTGIRKSCCLTKCSSSLSERESGMFHPNDGSNMETQNCLNDRMPCMDELWFFCAELPVVPKVCAARASAAFLRTPQDTCSLQATPAAWGQSLRWYSDDTMGLKTEHHSFARQLRRTYLFLFGVLVCLC